MNPARVSPAESARPTRQEYAARSAAARSKSFSAFSVWVVSDTLTKTLTDRPTDLASTWAA